MVARVLDDVGLEVRSVTKLATHPVYRVRAGRGRVRRGEEADAVRSAIREALGRFGIKCREREIEAVVQGSAVKSSFIFANGRPGTLSFYRGQSNWTPESG